MNKTKYLGFCSGKLTKGCQLCVLGNKTVLFITGKCNRHCYYCPLPESRKGKDLVYANERKLSDVNAVNEALEEAELCQSKGLGITGGNPFLVLKRVEKYARAFKKKFGRNFHIHIYLPTEQVTKAKLEGLAKAGIDEFRFHPRFGRQDFDEIEKIEMANSLKKKYSINVGIEIPAVPKSERQAINFFAKIDNLDFLNLNEFEMSVLNADALMSKGMDYEDNSVAIRGSKKTALKILQWCEKNKSFPVHYCSASTKNLFQFKNRLKRRAESVSKEYSVKTHDGELIHGAIYLSETRPLFNYDLKIQSLKKNKAKYRQIIGRLNDLRKLIIKEFEIPSNLIEVDKQFLRITTLPIVTKDFSEEIKHLKAYPAIIKELPTYDKIILDLEWL